MPVDIKGEWRPFTAHYDDDPLAVDISRADLSEFAHELSGEDPDQELRVWIHGSELGAGLRLVLLGLCGCCGSADLAEVIAASLDEETDQEERLDGLIRFRDRINTLIDRYSPASQGSEGERR